jgi:hypothetical protein
MKVWTHQAQRRGPGTHQLRNVKGKLPLHHTGGGHEQTGSSQIDQGCVEEKDGGIVGGGVWDRIGGWV